ncbi:LacI family DNA-binding transcriptional regulator [Rhodococcus sp. G-MC3]|uniref:LacI family DNA-binding transcriptional regulator n=1 Tax=Rhodococcus sp. G-MC3 TaxID=3046209 RepID=UPI0024BAFADC|nr:LacI family DNA-binding transcriptional regulator [Rhodococcus sp. G-MC3]MDJ0394418.1 LacI family DNA-binding transcriptional regulator [Rhodococcus sp. G-MC3]
MSTRPTMADVAAAAGVSTMSVSYTYNQPTRVSTSTREKVHAAATALGYTGPNRAARSLRSGKSNNLGVILTEKLTYSFDNAQARAFLSGIADACLDTDTGLVLLPNSRVGVDLDRVRDAHVDGFVVWTTVVDDPMLEVVASTGKPVCIQGGPKYPGTQLVGIDDQKAAHAIGNIGLHNAKHPAVISFPRNRERIGEIVLGPEPEDATFPVTAARLAGYRQAVVDAGVDWAQVPVAFVETNARAHGAAAMKMLSPNRCGAHTLVDRDAILCSSDELAFGVLDVRRDISVTGWDDSEAAESAGLTTVSQSLYEQGRDAARWALGTVDTIPDATWTLKIRSSTQRSS